MVAQSKRMQRLCPEPDTTGLYRHTRPREGQEGRSPKAACQRTAKYGGPRTQGAVKDRHKALMELQKVEEQTHKEPQKAETPACREQKRAGAKGLRRATTVFHDGDYHGGY